jgi:hypothetical protein
MKAQVPLDTFCGPVIEVSRELSFVAVAALLVTDTLQQSL